MAARNLTMQAGKAQRRNRPRPRIVAALRARLRDAEEMLEAMRVGEVDAIVRSTPSGEQIYTLTGADRIYRTMVETMGEGAVTLSPTGTILYVNRQFADLFATDLGKIIGCRLQDFVEPADEAALTALLRRSQDDTTRSSIRLRRSSGVPVSVHLAMRRLDVDGMKCIIAIVTDLSELERSRQELRRADEQFRLAIDAAPTGMLLLDVAGCIVLVNAQVEDLFGYRRVELMGHHIEMLAPERARAHPLGFVSGSPGASKSTAHGGLFGRCKDGSEVPIETTFTQLRSSQGELTLASIVDLSPRLEIDRMRSDFVATVSHELRTPLTCICGSLGLLKSGVIGTLPEGAASLVRIADTNSGRLVRIINDILDIGTLETGKLSLRMVSLPLADLVRQAVEANLSYAAMCQVRLSLEHESTDDRVTVDPDRLVQVITNLLSNAAKFSPPESEVTIRILPGAAIMRIEVEDRGPGIPVEFQVRIFEKFAQADGSPTRRFGGSGLGLSISRKLIEAMGGCIGFRSTVGRGSLFYFEIPRTGSSLHGSIAASPRAPDQ
jgi:PAS domain S-box-containing protein